MSDTLNAIFQRRAVKVFEPVEIPSGTREQILDAARLAPSSFNIQPYRFYWVGTPEKKKTAAQLCFSQAPAETASALIVAVADIGSWRSTSEMHLEWLRKSGASEKEFSYYREKIEVGQVVFLAGLVRDVGRSEMDDSAGAAFVEDYRDGAGFASGIVQVGSKEHFPCLRKSDDRRRNAGVEHLPDGRIRRAQARSIAGTLHALP